MLVRARCFSEGDADQLTTENAAGWPTVMISVSDHETGGMALARQLDPALYPECVSMTMSRASLMRRRTQVPLAARCYRECDALDPLYWQADR
jgi:alkaline phosphatase